MSGITYDYMEKYIRELIPEHDGPLKDLEGYAHKNAVPIISKEVGKLLELMINIKKPQNILELGTAIGYSAILMNLASNGNSKITTIERDDIMVESAQNNFKKYGVENKINIIHGDCIEVLQKLQEKFDFIFIDAGKGHYNHFLPHCLRMLNSQGVIVADNVLFRGMVASKQLATRRSVTIIKRMKSYLELVSKDDTLITSVIPIGDGIAITSRRNEND